MSTKQIKGVIIPRHDIAKNWAKAVNFIPKDSELIVYKSDEDTYDTTVTINGTTYPVQSSDKIRFKFGDGVSNVNALPFVETGSSVGGVTYEQMVEYVEQTINDEITDKKTVRGKALVLNGVHSLQSDMKISLVSDNLVDCETIKLTELSNAVAVSLPAGKTRGYKLSSTSDRYSGNGNIEIELPTYDTYYVHTYAESTSSADSISVLLFDGDTRISRHKLTDLNSTYTIDAAALHVNKVVIYADTTDSMYFDCYIGTCANPTTWECPSDSELYDVTVASRNLCAQRTAYLTGADYKCEVSLTAYSPDRSQTVAIPILVDSTNTTLQRYSIGPTSFPISEVVLTQSDKIKWSCEQYIPAGTLTSVQFFADSIDSRDIDLNNIQLTICNNSLTEYDIFTAATVESDSAHNLVTDAVQYPYTTLIVGEDADYAGYTFEVQYDCMQYEETFNDKLYNAIESINNTLQQLIDNMI